MPLDEQLNMQQRDVQEIWTSQEYKDAEDNQMFHFELPRQETLNKTQKSVWKRADNLKKAEKRSLDTLRTLSKKIMKTTDPEKNERLEIKIKKESLKLALLKMQERQMRLSVLPGKLAMKKKAEIESLSEIIHLRQDLMNLYASKNFLNEEDEADMLSQQAALRQEVIAYENAQQIHDLQVKLLITKKRVKEDEENHPKEDATLLEDFKNISLSLDSIQKEYIYEHMSECLQQVRLIQKIQEMKRRSEWKTMPMEERMGLELKLEALQDYTGYIRSMFLDKGIDILSENLQPQDTPESVSRRRAYLAGGYLRLEKACRTYQDNDYEKMYHRGKEEAEKFIRKTKSAISADKDFVAIYTGFGEEWCEQHISMRSANLQVSAYQHLIELMNTPNVQEMFRRDPRRFLRLHQVMSDDASTWGDVGYEMVMIEYNTYTGSAPFQKDEYLNAKNQFLQMMGAVLQEKGIEENAYADSKQDTAEVLVEQRLSDLEEEFQVRPLNKEEAEQKEDQKIAKQISRPVNEQKQNGNGEVKADFEDALGSMNRFYEKNRIWMLYDKMNKKVKDPVFASLKESMEMYAGLFQQINESREDYAVKERTALNNLQKQLSTVISQTSGQAFRYASLLQSLLTENTDGTLKVEEDVKPAVHKDTEFYMGVDTHGRKREWSSRKKVPLFAHAPGIKDVEQGRLGDCYLLAALNTIMSTSPEVIRECMKDNGDGTVTVRFFTDRVNGEKQKPIYVTVEKTVPTWKEYGGDCYAQGTLWVQMIEKAYAASGLRKKNNEEKKRREDQLSYEDIAGGFSGIFLLRLLGRPSKDTYKITSSVRNGIAVKTILDRIPASAQINNWPEHASITKKPLTELLHELLTDDAQRTQLKTVNRYNPADDQLVAEFDKKLNQLKLHLCLINDVAVAKEKPIEKITDAEELRTWLRQIKEIIRTYRNKPRKIDSFLRETLDQHKYDDFELDEFNKTVDQLIQRLDVNWQPVKTDNIYTEDELHGYNRISEELKEGNYLTVGTRKLSDNKKGLNGESERAGMVGTHEYTIMGTKEQVIGGVTHKYVMLLNPWATHGVVYKEKEDNHNEIAALETNNEAEEGVFLLDLRDFFYVVDDWDTVKGEN